MSGIEGVPVVQHPFFPRYVELGSLFPGERATHRAIPEPVAAALVEVAEAGRFHAQHGTPESWRMFRIALDALAEAQAGAA